MPILETRDQITHGQFADNTNITIEAKQCYIDNLFEIFRTLRDVSKLYVKEQKVKAVHILQQALSKELLNLDWEWETKAKLSKLLGICMGSDVFPQCMLDSLENTHLEKCLEKFRKNPYLLVVRVQIAN